MAHQVPLSLEFSRQEYWSVAAIPSPRNLSNQGIEPGSALQANSLPPDQPGKLHNVLGENLNEFLGQSNINKCVIYNFYIIYIHIIYIVCKLYIT